MRVDVTTDPMDIQSSKLSASEEPSEKVQNSLLNKNLKSLRASSKGCQAVLFCPLGRWYRWVWGLSRLPWQAQMQFQGRRTRFFWASAYSPGSLEKESCWKTCCWKPWFPGQEGLHGHESGAEAHDSAVFQ